MSAGPCRSGVFPEALDGVAELGDDAVRIGRQGRDFKVREVPASGLEAAQTADARLRELLEDMAERAGTLDLQVDVQVLDCHGPMPSVA